MGKFPLLRKQSVLILALGSLFQLIVGSASWAGQSVLYIGDSISYGKFGQEVDLDLRKIAPDVVSEASCGSSPNTWLTQPGQTGHAYARTVCGYWYKGESEERTKKHNTPKIEEELRKFRPKVTVIQLGTNIAASDHPQAQAASVRQMMKEIRASGSECIWIGPPDANSKVVTREKLRMTNQMIEKEAAGQGCYFVDMLSVTRFPAAPGDGIHPAPYQAEEWARLAIQKIHPLVVQVLAKSANPHKGNSNVSDQPSENVEAHHNGAAAFH